MQFEAKVRVILKPLVGLIPIVGGIQVCDSILLAGLIIEVYYHFMVKISFFFAHIQSFAERWTCFAKHYLGRARQKFLGT